MSEIARRAEAGADAAEERGERRLERERDRRESETPTVLGSVACSAWRTRRDRRVGRAERRLAARRNRAAGR